MTKTLLNDEPFVSIILPTYNRASLINYTLQSIMRQSYMNWECLIIDDQSTDNTKEIIQPLINSDHRFHYFIRSSKYLKGPSGCRNQGLDLARGQYVIFFDSDDIVHPENIKLCLQVLRNDNYDFCRYDKSPFRGDWNQEYSFDNNPFQINNFSLDDISTMITMEAGFACCSVMWKKSAFKDMRFDEELSYAEEWEFYTRLLSQGIAGASINKVLYFNRKHPQSNTGEFWSEHPVRRKSKLNAVKKVIDTLGKRKLLDPYLVKYFIRLGFTLQQYVIIEWILEKTNSNRLSRFKYYVGFKFYPLIRPLFKFKAKFIQS